MDKFINKTFNNNAEWLLPQLPDESVDVICTDPPYQYLKHRLDIPFDENLVFSELKRILKPNGFIIMFGRGVAFYRWNYMISELGFNFKESVVWDKTQTTSPLLPLSRVHEDISIWCKGKAGINRVKIPYLEIKHGDIPGIIRDIKRIKACLNNSNVLDSLMSYLKENIKFIDKNVTRKHNISISSPIKSVCRSAAVLQSINDGYNEKSIIKETRDHYNTIHPTQKPVKLIVRLLNLVCSEYSIVVDPFAGSHSTAEACLRTNRKFICSEIDKEWYVSGVDRINKIMMEPVLF